MSKKPIMRALMYSPFIALSILPFIFMLGLWSNVSTTLFASGAGELAFAFYAFTSGNGAYSMVPGLKHRVVRKHVLNKAVGIIRAARMISLGAAFLIISGIVVNVSDLNLIQPPVLLAATLVAFILVFAPLAYGTIKLFRNISFVPNEYLESERLKDYYDATKNRQKEEASKS